MLLSIFEICKLNYLLTVSFARPFARRFAKTLRPVGDFMRMRKPWVFARLRLFG
jgi:hypothetical protein